jgi:hypothetical protein
MASLRGAPAAGAPMPLPRFGCHFAPSVRCMQAAHSGVCGGLHLRCVTSHPTHARREDAELPDSFRLSSLQLSELPCANVARLLPLLSQVGGQEGGTQRAPLTPLPHLTPGRLSCKLLHLLNRWVAPSSEGPRASGARLEPPACLAPASLRAPLLRCPPRQSRRAPPFSRSTGRGGARDAPAAHDAGGGR